MNAKPDQRNKLRGEQTETHRKRIKLLKERT